MAQSQEDHPLDRAALEALVVGRKLNARIHILRISMEPSNGGSGESTNGGREFTPAEKVIVQILDCLEKPATMKELARLAGHLGEGKGQGYFSDLVRQLEKDGYVEHTRPNSKQKDHLYFRSQHPYFKSRRALPAP